MVELTLASTAGGDALYVAPGGLVSYLRFGTPGDPRPTLTPTSAWTSSGAFLLSAQPLTLAPDKLAELLALPGPLAGTRAVAWIDQGPTARLAGIVPIMSTGPTTGQVGPETASLAFGNVVLQLSSSSAVTVTDDALSFTSAGLSITRTGMGGLGVLAPGSDATLALDGPVAGRLAFTAAWDAYSLYQFFRDNPFDISTDPRGGELRYFRSAAGGGYDQLVYPTLPSVGAAVTVDLAFDVELDPGAPFDGTRTRMRFQVGSVPAALQSTFAATTAGVPVGLVPLAQDPDDRAGFSFGLRPDPLVAGAVVYLAPLGPFALQIASGSARVMCGANGLEYFAANQGDVLTFTPSRPALGTAGPGDQALLDSTFTTAWADVSPGAASDAPIYFGQPAASASFAPDVIPPQDGKTMALPAAVAARIRALPAGVPFPLALYGGSPTVAGVADADGLLAFEQAVLAPTRAGLLHAPATTPTDPVRRPDALTDPAPTDPVPPDPVFADATGTPISGGRTTTPQGFLVGLNDATTGPVGTWADVQLAVSGAEQLAFGPSTGAKTVDPWLATTLLRDQLFLVLNDWERFPMAQRTLAVAGFNFELAPQGADRDTVLVFKFSTARSLTELVADTGSWAHKNVFVGDDAQVAAALRTLQAALKVAATPGPAGDDPFVYFRAHIADNASWTGMLSFNGPIDGNGMPADLQMLFAGIDGPLRAHHFGVEINRVTRKPPAPPQILESALFGVVHYELIGPPPKPPAGKDFAFSVEELNVAIHNSNVTEFYAKVAVTIDALFGRAVTMAPASTPSNTIELIGQYQRHGNVGTVTFDAAAQARFSFAGPPGTARVLDALVVTGAALVPVASTTTAGTGGAGGSQIHARVTLSGALAFAADPFPGVTGVDLFSYGAGSTGGGLGVGVAGVALDVSCTLDSNGVRQGQPTIALDLSAVVVADDPTAVRTGSLVHGLPITLTGFLQDTGGPDPANPDPSKAGLDPAKLGALPVNVLELATPTGGGSCVTSRPTYALRFRLPLGSLGALSDVHASIDASLVLGWGPSPTTPDADAAAVLVQLPSLSAGAFGFNLEGLLKTTFGDANLMHVTPHGKAPVYVLLFNNVALSLLGLKLPPRVITDFILFAGPQGASSLGWSLAATLPQQSGDQDQLAEVV